MNTDLHIPQEEVNRLCEEAGIKYLALFGSQARGDMKTDSDVDLLVEFGENPGLIGFIRTKNQLEQIFDRKVDLVTRKGLSKYLKPYVEKDLQVIYG